MLTKNMLDDYQVLQKLHKRPNGPLSEVFLVASKKTGKKYILKKLQLTNTTQDLMVFREIMASKTLKHSNIVRMHDLFEDVAGHQYLIMEYVEGLDLFSWLESRGFFPLEESLLRNIFLQLVKAVYYCHRQDWVHHDIKLENAMIKQHGKGWKVKLIDFGLSGPIERQCKRWCGSSDYVSPEILQNTPYNNVLADVWSLGTILYMLAFGAKPFVQSERMAAVANHLPHPGLEKLDKHKMRRKEEASEELLDLLHRMLEPNPLRRITLRQVLKHKWLTRDHEMACWVIANLL